jgi:hypothetical protein
MSLYAAKNGFAPRGAVGEPKKNRQSAAVSHCDMSRKQVMCRRHRRCANAEHEYSAENDNNLAGARLS